MILKKLLFLQRIELKFRQKKRANIKGFPVESEGKSNGKQHFLKKGVGYAV
jgi:hypothetical protein